jgi:outer membrane protein TolC
MLRYKKSRAVRGAAPLLAVVLAATAPLVAQQDPLGALVREGLENNLGLTETRLETTQRELDVTRARALFLPTAGVDARYSALSGVLDIGQFINPAYQTLNQLTGTNAFPTDLRITQPFKQDMRVRVTQPLFDASILANYSLARSLREVQRGRLGGSARELAAGIQLGYLQYASARQVVALYRSTLDVLQENLRVSERLVAAGSITPDAVSRARADLSETTQRLAEAEQQRDAAVRALNQLLNRPLDRPVEVIPDSALAFPLTLTLDEALARASDAREELQEADFGIRAARAQTRLAEASFLPSVALAVDYGFQGNRLRFSGDNDFTVASLVVQWNLFNGGRDAARRRQGRLETERAQVARADLETRIALQVRQAYEAAVVARDAIPTAGTRLEAAGRTFELVRRRYDEGLAPHLEFTQARADLTNAGLNEILTRYAYAARYVELERAAALRTIEP